MSGYHCDIAIIGAGASGLAAAVAAKRADPRLSVRVFEKNDSPGKKLLATGNGRCNLTNTSCPDAQHTLGFLASLGIMTRVEEGGRVYPYSGRAEDVLGILERNAASLGVEIITGFAAAGVARGENGGFVIAADRDRMAESDRLILAAGGKAGPQYGTSGDGYMFAKRLGHTVTRLYPVLAGVEVSGGLRELKGVRARALAKLFRNGNDLAEEKGEVQFNDYGLSGICVMDLTRFITTDGPGNSAEGFSGYQISLDLVPEMSEAALAEYVLSRDPDGSDGAAAALASVLPAKLASYAADRAQTDAGRGSRTPESVPKTSRGAGERAGRLAAVLKDMRFAVSGVRGWREAQCTGGGVASSEIDPETMESKLCPGLYIAGEMLEYAGPCGGYNLNNAWVTGEAAGNAAALSLR